MILGVDTGERVGCHQRTASVFDRLAARMGLLIFSLRAHSYLRTRGYEGWEHPIKEM